MVDRQLTLGVRFIGKLDASLSEMDKRIARSLGRAQTELKKYANGLKRVTTETSNLEQASARTNKQIGVFANSWKRLTAAMKVTASYGAAATALYSITAAFRTGTKEIIDYDQALKNIQAITKATDAEVLGMGEAMRDLARDTKFSTGEVAEGMVLLGQAGFTAAEVLDSIRAATTLATGTLSDMKMTTDLLTTTIRAFMLDASESGRVVDVMASAINRSKLTIDKLRIAFNFVGSAAAQTGLSLEETAASMMVLANNGLRASTIGTGLRQVLSRLLAPNAKLRHAFERHGIALDKVNPRLVGYETAMRNLLPLIWDSTKGTVNMTKAYELFGLRGAQAAAVITKAFVSGEWEQMIENVYDVGSATRMALLQQEGLGVKFKNLADRAKNVALAIGDAGVTGALNNLVDTLKDAVTWVENFIRDYGRLVFDIVASTTVIALATSAWLGISAAMAATTATGIVAFLSVVGKNLIGLRAIVGVVTAAWQGLLAIWALPGGPIALAIAGVAALVTTFMAFNRQSERSAASVHELSQEIVKYGQVTQKLEGLQKKLTVLHKKYGDGTEKSREYRSELNRLIEDMPEAAELAGELADSYEKGNKSLQMMIDRYRQLQMESVSSKLENMIETFTRVAPSEKFADAINRNIDDIDTVYHKVNKVSDWFLIMQKKMTPEFIKQNAETIRTFTEINELVIKYAKNLSKLTDDQKLSRDQALLLIKTYFQNADVIKEVIRVYDELMNTKKKTFELDDTSEAETEKLRRARLASERRYINMMAQYAIDERDKLKHQHELRLDDIRKYKEEREKLLEEGKVTELEIAWEVHELERAEEERFRYEMMKLTRDLGEKKLQIALINRKAELKEGLIGQKITEQREEQFKKDQLDAEIQFQNERIELYRDFYNKLVAVRGAEDPLVKAALVSLNKLIADARLQIVETETKAAKQEADIYRKYLEERIKAAEYWKRDWIDIVKSAYEAGVISYRDYQTKMLAITGTAMENLKAGIDRVKGSMGSFNNLMRRMGEEGANKFASDLADEMWNIADGTKSAGEAFQDFARGMLKWTAKMIMQWAILRAMGFPAAGSYGANPAAGTPGQAGMFVPTSHRGSIAGNRPQSVKVVNPWVFQNAPRLHNGGIARDEVPAILRKGEGVFTEDQMRSMGNISIVNVTDSRMLDQYMASPQGKRAILNVISNNPMAVRKIVR